MFVQLWNSIKTFLHVSRFLDTGAYYENDE